MSRETAAELIDGFRRAGEEDRPVYVTDVSDALERCPDAVPIRLELQLSDRAEQRVLTIGLPHPATVGPERTTFLRKYLEARVCNLISTFGGRSLAFRLSSSEPGILELLQSLDDSFGVHLSKAARRGYGRCLNVAERMTDALDGAPGPTARFRFSIEQGQAELGNSVGPGLPRDLPARDNGSSLEARLRAAPGGLAGRSVIGIDVGGTDIKLVACIGGRLIGCLEYDWFPTRFTTSAELVEPVILLARWGCARAAVERIAVPARRLAMAARLDAAAESPASLAAVRAAVEEVDARSGRELVGLDAIGLCFPDVVVKNKIVGGEVYKTRGIRNNCAIDYESDFRRITHLDRALSALCCPEGRVRIVNDGPMAAFTAALEGVIAGRHRADDGVLAYTLGTELGTGWIDPEGNLPEIPLEVYNYVIDLGSLAGAVFEPDDPRSINNFNTGVPGTAQKYASQSGVFRVALACLSQRNTALYDRLFSDGYLVSRHGAVAIPSEPSDMRKPLLELLQGLVSKDETVRDAYRYVGEYLAVTWLETTRMLGHRPTRPILFGRVVKDPACMALIQEGAASRSADIALEAADEGLAATSLMRQLRDAGRYRVAQFAQAVGAAHFSVW